MVSCIALDPLGKRLATAGQRRPDRPTLGPLAQPTLPPPGDSRVSPAIPLRSRFPPTENISPAPATTPPSACGPFRNRTRPTRDFPRAQTAGRCPRVLAGWKVACQRCRRSPLAPLEHFNRLQVHSGSGISNSSCARSWSPRLHARWQVPSWPRPLVGSPAPLRHDRERFPVEGEVHHGPRCDRLPCRFGGWADPGGRRQRWRDSTLGPETLPAETARHSGAAQKRPVTAIAFSSHGAGHPFLRRRRGSPGLRASLTRPTAPASGTSLAA